MTKKSTKAKAATKRPRRASKAAPAINIRADLIALQNRRGEDGDWTQDHRHLRRDGGTVARKSVEEVYKLAAKKLGEDEHGLRERYKNLNLGMQRMNLGNRIRAASKEASAK